MKVRPTAASAPGWDRVSQRLKHWQSVRTWAWLIREAEALWSEDSRFLQRLGAAELLQVVQEVPPRLRRRVNLWLERFDVLTRLSEPDRE
jgi:hypothetical protein